MRWTSQDFACRLRGVDDETTTARRFADEVRRRRGDRPVRAIALEAGISEGRWRQIEAGFQAAGAVRIPVRPRPPTVRKVARALNWDQGDALLHAGFTPEMAAEPHRSRPVGFGLDEAAAQAGISKEQADRIRDTILDMRPQL